MKRLEEKKQRLLLESELNRQVIGLELDVIRLQMSQWKGGLDQFPGVWKWAVPVLGFLVAYRYKQILPALLAKGTAGLATLVRLRKLLQSLFGRKDSPKDEKR